MVLCDSEPARRRHRQMTNDDCAGAITLTVDTSCNYSYFTNATATASGGAPAPGCGNYLGGDVWFKLVVPANGVIRVNSLGQVVTDGGMALYTGTCGSLTLVSCDDSSSANPGDMPLISQSGLTSDRRYISDSGIRKQQ
jgi:hypothetical protein